MSATVDPATDNAATPEELPAGKYKALPADALADLRGLLAEATPGRWYIDKGLFANALWITTQVREMEFRGRREGTIATVHTERLHFRDLGHGETSTRKIPLPTAAADAALIVAAVNGLPDLLNEIERLRAALAATAKAAGAA